jgi:hypothetical protein
VSIQLPPQAKINSRILGGIILGHSWQYNCTPQAKINSCIRGNIIRAFVAIQLHAAGKN